VHPLIVIVGPTASGKTALSLALAQRFPAEIVSCDSVAVYREFEIGTAKPSREERVKAPHRMIDVADPTEPFTAGEYSRCAREVLAEIRQRVRLPIVVGGTGFYLRALLEGLFPGPQRSDELRHRLRRRAGEYGSGYLRRVLARVDPDAARAIHANDLPKIIRALEVCLGSGGRISEMQRCGRDPLTGFDVIKIGLNPDRAALYARINDRCARMFEHGLIEETRLLLTKYPQLLENPSSPLNALGYRQAVQHIRGEITYEQTVTAAQQAHRNYAKRQLTWFRNINAEGTHWLAGFGDDPSIQAEVIQIAAAHIPR
jgi:tRNA dimethylallyltransferase